MVRRLVAVAKAEFRHNWTDVVLMEEVLSLCVPPNLPSSPLISEYLHRLRPDVAVGGAVSAAEEHRGAESVFTTRTNTDGRGRLAKQSQGDGDTVMLQLDAVWSPTDIIKHHATTAPPH